MPDKRIAIVTGAARGIGREVVLELARGGCHVVGLDIMADHLKELESVAKEQGLSVETKCLDITDTDLLTETLESVIKTHGSVGILVNNAGITRDGLMIQISNENLDKVMDVNFRAAFIATRIVLRPMIRNKFGRVISLSSVAGVMGNAGQANYASSKAALIGMTKSVAREVAKKGVTANCIAPGFIRTEMTDILPEPVKDAAKQMIPARRFGKPADIAKAIAFLASEEAGYITGQVLCVDGGMAM
jgi:3-oxoacyl-[acyl-carrier protein] reductase